METEAGQVRQGRPLKSGSTVRDHLDNPDGAPSSSTPVKKQICGTGTRRRRHARQPATSRSGRLMNLLRQKFAVALVVLIFAYSYYVYLGRFCISMIQREQSTALGSRTTGIVFTVFYHCFFLMFLWTYTRVVLTSPGLAKRYCPQKTEPPQPLGRDAPTVDTTPSIATSSRDPPRHEQDSEVTLRGFLDQAPDKPPTDTADNPAIKDPDDRPREPSTTAGERRAPTTEDKTPDLPDGSRLTRLTTALSTLCLHPQNDILGDMPEAKGQGGPLRGRKRSGWLESQRASRERRKREASALDRDVDMKRVLDEDVRFCARCQIVRPPRTHHCRTCQTCVLKMDHHCPWVGHCVGAFNYKYFYHFVQWAFVYCLYIFLTLVVPLAIRSGSNSSNDIPDAQYVVLLVIAILFALFTGILFVAHTRLITLNVTTIEDIKAGTFLRNETDDLNRVLGRSLYWYNRQMTRAWNERWGDLRREGNLYWKDGGAYANWTEVLGTNPVGWCLPIEPRASREALKERTLHPTAFNPRFNASGQPRPRPEWPRELQ